MIFLRDVSCRAAALRRERHQQAVRNKMCWCGMIKAYNPICLYWHVCSAQSCYWDYWPWRYHFIKENTQMLRDTHTHTHSGCTEMAWGLVMCSIAQGNCVNGLLWMSWCDGKRVWINKEPIKRWQSAAVCSQSFTPHACVQLYNMSVKEGWTISLLKTEEV